MKKTLLYSGALVTLALAGYFIGSASGQNSKAAPPDLPHKVGLIDMAQVFKDYKKFELLREDLKSEVQDKDGQAKGMMEQITTLQTKLKSLKPGTEGFTEHEKKLAELSSDYDAQRKLWQLEFMRKESKIYHAIYMEVLDAVEKFSKHYNYTMIMRFSRDELSSTDPQKLMQGLNKQIVYHRVDDDITESVVEYLNRRYKPAASPQAGAPGANPSRTATKPAATTPR